MAIPTNAVSMPDLTEETTLDGTENLVGFDSTEAKKIPVSEVRTFVLNGLSFSYSDGRLTITKGAE